MDASWRTHTISFDGVAERRVTQEWLLTNSTGAYAASTAPGINTRRYHGLLVAATDPPVGRVVALNQVWDQLVLRRPAERASARGPRAFIEQPFDLATLQFPGEHGPVLAPAGCRMLTRFERGASVRWTWRCGEITIERELFLHWKEQAVTLHYHVSGLDKFKAKAALRLAPMMTLRDFHAMTREHAGDPFEYVAENDTLTVTRGGLAVTCRLPGARFDPNPHWWYNVFYAADHERGQEDREDYFVPGAFVADVPKSGQVTLTCALGREAAKPTRTTTQRAHHLEKIETAIAFPQSKIKNQKSKILALASDDFVVDRTVGDRKLSTILAGYPWFADWGRDTFIALPGLLLATQRFDEANNVLRAFAGCLRDGLVPNRFDDYAADAASAHYNTADAPLWFVHAAFEYLEKSGDSASWKRFLQPAITSIVDAYAAGTRADTHDGKPVRIYADDDGLIVAGHAGTQLTWMDAACGGTVFTPRHGKAVEINALWYNALVRLAELSRPGRHYAQLARKVRASFPCTFHNPRTGGLYDHVTPDGQRDESVRPNQIFAVSLPHSPLHADQREGVLDLVRDRLLVPMGLRTLPPDDPHYHPRYTGDQFHRDAAYHQGAVWPWLIGPYAEAVLRVHGFSADARRRAARAIAPLLEQLTATDDRPCALGQLHEIYEADFTDRARPVGCFAQAWSIAEVLRVSQLIGE